MGTRCITLMPVYPTFTRHEEGKISVLTDSAIQKFKPRATRREVPDGTAPGLYLVIQPSGAKSFALRFRRPDGKPAKLTLGAYSSEEEPKDEPVLGAPLTLAMARQLAAAIQRERKRGVDVVAEYKSKKERQDREHEQRAANSFAAAVIDFCKDHKPNRDHRLKHWRYTSRVLGLDYPLNGGKPSVIPGSLANTWANKPLADIDDHDIHVVVKEARDHGVPGIGRRNKSKSDARARTILSALSLLFRWLLAERRVASNPCLPVARAKPATSRDRVMSEAELRSFWLATDQIGEPFGALLKLLLLTGCRREEVAGMRWAELSADCATWTIPSARTKNWREHIVPLPPLARHIIGRGQRIEGDFVFTTTGRSSVSGFSRVKQRLDGLMDNAPAWRIHDLRRTCATGMASIGIQPHIVEAVLNHVSGAKAGVAGTYNQYLYFTEKTVALERWATHVEALVSGTPSNVVSLHGRTT